MQLSEIFEQMKKHYVPSSVDKEISIYFSIGDGEDGKWTVFLSPLDIKITKGKTSDNADLFLKTTLELFKKMIFEGYTPGAMDFMRGKIKSNDPLGLMVLKKAFKLQ